LKARVNPGLWHFLYIFFNAIEFMFCKRFATLIIPQKLKKRNELALICFKYKVKLNKEKN